MTTLAPSVARNREPILAVLRRVLPAQASVLEIASGTGEHALFFAAAMGGWNWGASEPDAEARAALAARFETAALPNLAPVRAIDASAEDWRLAPGQTFDAVVCINMIHISPWQATLGLMAGSARALGPEGVLYTYGAYKRAGAHTAASNEAFDAWLKERDPSFGVRDLADVERAASERGLRLREIVEMPANNFSLVFRRN